MKYNNLFNKQNVGAIIIIVVSSSGFLIPNLPLFAKADSLNPSVFSPDTKPFGITFPQNNLLGAPPGNTQVISDGFWVFLQPLTIGKHEIHFSGLTVGNPTTGTANFAIDTTYHLTIQ